MIVSPKTAFLDTTFAVERAKRLKMQQNLFVMMCVSSTVVLRELDTVLELTCHCKDFWITCFSLLAACCCLLLDKLCCTS